MASTTVARAHTGVSSAVQPKPGLGGTGTEDDPIVIDWDGDDDKENPWNWSNLTKLTQTYQIAFSTFCVSLGSSMYAGGARGIAKDVFRNDGEVTALGISLYVLGFGLGPLARTTHPHTLCTVLTCMRSRARLTSRSSRRYPRHVRISPDERVHANSVTPQMYGRRKVFICSWIPFTLSQLGCWFARNPVQMLAFRLIGGAVGSAPLTGGGGGVSDMFAPRDRAFAMALYTMMPFMGPILGPLIGGAIAQNAGWRRIFLVLFCFAAMIAIVNILNMRESYTPVLLRWRARRLHLESGGTVHYLSKYDVGRSLSLAHLLRVNLSRPF
ncbi:MFS general substrate transporter, partial [Exidia glandulosa HHB12029]